MIKKLAHIGIAVKNIDEALLFYALAGIKASHIEEVPSQKVKTAFLAVGDTHIELLEATAADSPIAKYLEKKGPGIHHIAYEVDDITAELAKLKAGGIQLINETPVEGAHGMLVAFIHPKSTNGVLTEYCQHM